jgi:hypothetical protein
MSFKVKLHNWIEGVLHFVEHEFEELEVALGFAKESTSHQIKVYNSDGEVVYMTVNSDGTYA